MCLVCHRRRLPPDHPAADSGGREANPMSNIVQQGAFGGGPSRSVSRTLSQIQGSTSLAIAQVEARAEVQASQVDAMAAITQRALSGVAFISQVEQQLAQAVPIAASRLQAVADIGTLGLTQVVMDTANQLRRC